MRTLTPVGVCCVYVIVWSSEYRSRGYCLSFPVLLFSLFFWIDVLFLKNWVVVDRGDVATLRCVISCCAACSTPPLKT